MVQENKVQLFRPFLNLKLSILIIFEVISLLATVFNNNRGTWSSVGHHNIIAR